MNQKTTYFIGFFTSFVLLTMAVPALAISYTVTTTDDENDGSPSCVTGSATDCSLREAISTANSNNSGNHTIAVPAGTYTIITSTSDDTNAQGDFDITNSNVSITINGATEATTIINGNDQDRVMHVITDASVVLNDLTITNGQTTGSGIGLYNSGTVALNNVTVSNNNATGDGFRGAGLYNDSGMMTLTDSTVTGNTNSAGHTNATGGGIRNDAGTLNIITSTISNNAITATSDTFGAGIYNTAVLNITDSTISGNTATGSGNGDGAGLYNQSTTNTVTIDGSTFSNNTGTGTFSGAKGGAIGIGDGIVNITNSTISGNIVQTGSTLQGGGLYNASGTLSVIHSSVVNNTAESGGGISGDATVQHSIIADNTGSTNAPDCGNGTITSNDYNVIENVTNCTISGTTTNNSTGTDPGLAALAANGGSTSTHAFTDAASSVAVNVIPAATCVSVLGANPLDQINQSRTGVCDVGAYEYSDTTSPSITVVGDNPATVECGDTYTDAGATATDNIDGTLTSSIATSSTVDTDTPASYTVTYTVSDVSTNQGTGTRTVTVSDTTAPITTLTGESEMSLTVGDTFTDLGATAVDTCDDSPTVDVTGTVDTTTAATYTLTYSAVDASDNTATDVTRTVIVSATEEDTGDEDVADHGAITTVTKSGATLTITYVDDFSETIRPFKKKKAFRFDISTNRTRLVVTNGKVIRVFKNGTKIGQKKIAKKNPRKKKHYRMKIVSFYNNYDSVVFASMRKNSAKLDTARIVVLRLNTKSKLKKKKVKTLSITNTKQIKVKIKQSKKRFTTTFGNGKSQVKNTWKLKKKGALKLVK